VPFQYILKLLFTEGGNFAFSFLMINPFVAELRRSFTLESQSVSSYEKTPIVDATERAGATCESIWSPILKGEVPKPDLPRV
jgi:hypothetical protein